MTDPKALAEKIAKECVDTFMDVMIDGADIKRPKLLNRIIEDQVSKAIAEAYDRAAEVAENHVSCGEHFESIKIAKGVCRGIAERIRALKGDCEL